MRKGYLTPRQRFNAARLIKEGKRTPEEIAWVYGVTVESLYTPTRRIRKKQLTPAQVKEIARLISEGKLTNSAIGARYNVTGDTISSIANGKRWQALTGFTANQRNIQEIPGTLFTLAELEEIYRLSSERKLTGKEIAQQYSVTSATILNALKAYSKHTGKEYIKPLRGNKYTSQRASLKEELAPGEVQGATRLLKARMFTLKEIAKFYKVDSAAIRALALKNNLAIIEK